MSVHISAMQGLDATMRRMHTTSASRRAEESRFGLGSRNTNSDRQEPHFFGASGWFL